MRCRWGSAGNPDIKQFVPETYEKPPLNLPHAEAEVFAAREAFAQSFADATAPLKNAGSVLGFCC